MEEQSTNTAKKTSVNGGADVTADVTSKKESAAQLKANWRRTNLVELLQIFYKQHGHMPREYDHELTGKMNKASIYNSFPWPGGLREWAKAAELEEEGIKAYPAMRKHEPKQKTVVPAAAPAVSLFDELLERPWPEEQLTFRLTRDEMAHPVSVAAHRTLGHLRKDNRVENDVEGALCEYLLAKILNHFFPGNHWSTAKTPDIYPEIDVKCRTNENPDFARMLLKPSDKKGPGDDPNCAYILCRGRAGEYTVIGWCYGRDVMKEKYLKNIGKEQELWRHEVPDIKLRPLFELEVILLRERYEALKRRKTASGCFNGTPSGGVQ